jgi:serine/threonine protein kinase
VWPGSILAGRYKVTGRLGGGSMGQIYRATQQPGGREVAIKVLSSEVDGNAERFRKRFVREAAVVARLNHPNVVAVYDYGETDNGDVFMAMEHIPGAPLSEVMRTLGPLPVSRALAISIQVARALRKAHNHGVVHRDLKPANIMVRPDEDGFDFVKVLDFGLLKLFSPDHGEVEGAFTDEALTTAGSLMGTPGYMAPEQAVGEAIDSRADIYSFGVMMFQMLTGRLPFEDEGLVELVTAQVLKPVPTIREVAPEVVVPDHLEQIVRRCLDRHRNLRYQTVDELLVDLKRVWRLETDESYGTETFSIPSLPVLVDLDGATAEPEERPFAEPSTLLVEPPVASRGPWVYLALAFLAVAITLGAWIGWGPERRPAEAPASAPPSAAPAPAPEGYKDNPY